MNPKYLLAAALMVAPAAARASADELDAKLFSSAPAVLDFLKAKKYESVGVLKFLVDKGDGNLSDNVGAINLGMADRLEVALILALPNPKTKIIYRASEAAAKNPQANHLTPEGRKALFGRKYPMAWGNESVQPDCFLTGSVVVSKNLKQTAVTVEAFGKDGALEKVLEFQVDTPLRVLAETGRSYLLTPQTNPELFARGKIAKKEIENTVVEQNIALDTSATSPPKPKIKPSVDKDGPIDVSIIEGKRKIDIVDGVTTSELKVGDEVTVRLENRTDDAYGVVLKVNGENTIFRERCDPRDCYKWILKPKETIYVSGFQETNDVRENFKVLSYEESKTNEVKYGPAAGIMEVTAFRGTLNPKPKPPATTEVKKEELMVMAISRGAVTFSDDGNLAQARPGTLYALKGKLESREKTPTGGRGLLGGGAQTGHKVDKVTFEADLAEPVMDYTIRYYQPKK